MVAAAIIKAPSVVVVLLCCPWREKLAVRKKLTRVAVRKKIKRAAVKKLVERFLHYVVVLMLEERIFLLRKLLR